MMLFSFSFFFLLAQTLQGIEGEVQCGNNNIVSSCFYCMFNPEANTPNEDPEYCNTSPDCMLNAESSGCVPRPDEVQCGNNDTVESCFYCMYNPNPTNDDPENYCSTSPDCMLSADSSGCVPRPENHSSRDPANPAEAPVLPVTPAEAPETPVNTPVIPRGADSSDTNQEVFLSRIKVNLKQPEQSSDVQFGLQVRVCNSRFACCGTGHHLTQIWGGRGSKQSVTFSAHLNNLGNCGDLVKDQTLDVTVFPITEGYHPDLMSVTIIFEDGSIFRKQELSRSCNWSGQNCLNRPQPLRWNTRYSDVHENINTSGRSREEPLPADQCPDVHNPSAIVSNVCPKDNVRVLREKPQRERKFCYYQE